VDVADGLMLFSFLGDLAEMRGIRMQVQVSG
jgi:hypothetical protein